MLAWFSGYKGKFYWVKDLYFPLHKHSGNQTETGVMVECRVSFRNSLTSSITAVYSSDSGV